MSSATAEGRPRLAQKDKERFTKLQAQELHVHAEMQLLCALATTEGLFNYLGSSKYCCCLCRSMLRNFGNLGHHGCHRGIFTRWTLPSTVHLSDETKSKLVHAIKRTYRNLQRSLESASQTGRHDAQPQPSKGLTEAGYGTLDRPVTARDWENQKAAKEASERQERLRQFDQAMEQLVKPRGLCVKCKTPTARHCDICGGDPICSTACERQYQLPHPTHCMNKSTGLRSPSSCTICGETLARLCKRCRASAYCDFNCFNEDQNAHSLLCETFSFVKYARPRPPP